MDNKKTPRKKFEEMTAEEINEYQDKFYKLIFKLMFIPLTLSLVALAIAIIKAIK